ncbi:MAG: hypothetical protein ACOYXY_10595 [Thermodesulfobacteriota bacterium]
MTCYLFAQTCSSTPRRRGDRTNRHLAWLVLVAVIALFVVIPESWAHRVNVYAYLEADRIVVEGYFGGKARAANCAVSVHDVNGNKIVEGRTDDKGVCVLRLTDAASAQGNLKVILDAGQGHRADYTIIAAHRVAAAGSSSKPETRGTAVRPALSEQASPGVLDGASQISSEQVTMLVNQALDEKMKPVLQMLGQQQRLLMEQSERSPGLREIIGGIGWIFGLVGVAAYFMSRRRNGQ